jgi:tetratricopeptide (TPR) repeat protein
MKTNRFFWILISLLFINCASSQAIKNYNIGNEQNEQGEYDNAIRSYYKALELNPEYAEAYSGLGYSYYMKGEIEKAIEYCNRAISINPNFPRSYLYLGYINYDRANNIEALNYFSKFIELDGNSATAFSYRGILYGRLGRNDLAIRDFNESLRINPNASNDYKNRAICYIQLNEFDKAFEDLNKAIELNPEDDNALGLRSIIYFQEYKNYSNALNDANKALEINPNNSFAKSVLAEAERNGISLTERGTSSISINITIGGTITEYLQNQPYLIATSVNTLVDRRFVDDGTIFHYLFDENTKILKAATWFKYSQNRQIRQDWFNNWLTQFLANGDDLSDISESGKRIIVNNTKEGNITKTIELNNEYAAIYFIILE